LGRVGPADHGHRCVGGHQVDDLAQAAPHLVRDRVGARVRVREGVLRVRVRVRVRVMEG
jgi:hypothetical protein